MNQSEFCPPNKKRKIDVSKMNTFLTACQTCGPKCYNSGPWIEREIVTPNALYPGQAAGNLEFSLLFDNLDTPLLPRKRNGWVIPDYHQTVLCYFVNLAFVPTHFSPSLTGDPTNTQHALSVQVESLRLAKIVHGSRMSQSLWETAKLSSGHLGGYPSCCIPEGVFPRDSF